MIWITHPPAAPVGLPRALRFVSGPVFRSLIIVLAVLVGGASPPAQAADRDRVAAFLTVTGFDVALDSIAQTAVRAPQMLGVEADSFGSDWNWVTEQVFDTGVMRGLATDILEATLSDEALGVAAAFYASDLGQRLVEVENDSHVADDSETKRKEGGHLVADMKTNGAPRLDLFKRMNRAVGSAEFSVRAAQEVQMRFLMAASAAGVIELRVDADELRALFKAQEAEMLREVQISALTGAAYVYRDFSDADIESYTVALEQPLMKEVYELLNAVQHEVMANRFELLAARMADLHPGQDI